MAESSIEWTDATWNPVAGCSIISPGCTNCYAMRMAARLDAMGMQKYKSLTRKSGKRHIWTGNVNLDYESLNTPYDWLKPRMVFVNSMSDLFHPDVPEFFIKKIWTVMKENNQHTFQILTKRPEIMKNVMERMEILPNVWLGTSVENEDYLHRIDLVRNTRAAIRFISFEPLIGSVKKANLKSIDWAIVGGESGPLSRPIEEEWVQEIHSSCRKSNTAFFFKQWGGKNKKATGRSFGGRTWDEFPKTGVSEYAKQHSLRA